MGLKVRSVRPSLLTETAVSIEHSSLRIMSSSEVIDELIANILSFKEAVGPTLWRCKGFLD